MALATDTPEPVRQLNPQIPEPLADLVYRLLAKRREQRPPTAEAVGEELARIEQGSLRPERPLPVPVSV